ncbi:MAG TPA: chemotaxis response regulator protein-glutamate methylesterase [Vicinamibacteria bacterium]|nr:chemotaxis response regulator protein-glutamate methylesterase [Vicinamibacteria bacterium]
MSGGRRIRVLVIDDSAFVRKAVTRMLGGAADIEVVGTAGDGEEGLRRARELRPDVVTLDIKMPRLGGLETLERLMNEQPVPVLLMSTLTQEGAEVTLRGLELGAMDFVDKSSVQPMSMLSLADELIAKVRALGGARLKARPHPVATRAEPGRQGASVVVIAASTGGPSALQQVVSALPAAFPAPVLIVQHIPRGFTRSLAERLDARSAIPVREARDGETLESGTILVAPAGIHTRLERREDEVVVVLDEEPRESLHRPSADVLMASAAAVFGSRVVGVVLTGMGSDGTEGLRAIRRRGGRTLAESEESCVIYGMPKVAIEAGVVDRAVPLDLLAEEMLAAV